MVFCSIIWGLRMLRGCLFCAAGRLTPFHGPFPSFHNSACRSTAKSTTRSASSAPSAAQPSLMIHQVALWLLCVVSALVFLVLLVFVIVCCLGCLVSPTSSTPPNHASWCVLADTPLPPSFPSPLPRSISCQRRCALQGARVCPQAIAPRARRRHSRHRRH